MDARATRTRPAVSAAQLPTQVQLSGNANGSANGCPIQVVQISIDGGGWQSVSIAGSVNAGNGYGQVHMTKYRAVETTVASNSVVYGSVGDRVVVNMVTVTA